MIHNPNCAITRWGDIRSWCDCGSSNEREKGNGLGNQREFRQAVQAAEGACSIRTAESITGFREAGGGFKDAGGCDLADEEGLSANDAG